ncbi:hypothetical protein Mapa_015441 [Marchantia paleacea]|nr:hypothetical protein Mapa_015441 [Marchantia paleacea]
MTAGICHNKYDSFRDTTSHNSRQSWTSLLVRADSSLVRVRREIFSFNKYCTRSFQERACTPLSRQARRLDIFRLDEG